MTSFITNKVVFRALAFTAGVAMILYVLITKQDDVIKDQLLNKEYSKIQELRSEIKSSNTTAANARQKILNTLNVSIDNQHVLLAYLKNQNKLFLNYLHSIHASNPPAGIFTIPQLNNSPSPAKSNRKVTKSKKSSKKANSKCQIQTSLIPPTLCQNQLIPPLMNPLVSKQLLIVPEGLLLPLYQPKVNTLIEQ